MAKTNKGRKLFATTATAALVASAIVPVASAAQVNDFNSVSSYAQEAVQSLVDRGVITGDEKGNFNPKKTVTRAEAAKIITEALGLEATGSIDFSDVKASAWYYDAIAAAVSNKIFEGQGAGKFNPTGNLTRSEAAKILVDAFGLEGTASLSSFKDAGSVKAWAKESLEIAVANGVMKGDDKGNLNPNASISKQEFAAMFYRTENLEAAPEVTGSVKAINNTTVEVTFKDAISDIKALGFKIDGLEVTNAVVKQTDSKTAVLTTAAQEADKTYTVSVDGEAIGSFKGVSAVIPTKVDLVSTSVQGKLGQEVTVKAKVTVAEGKSAAGIPVTFNSTSSNPTLNAPQVVEVKTDADGVATYTYTRYAAGNDTVVAYATGDRSKFATGYVFWGVDTILSVTEVTEGATINNGANKTYKVTYKDAASGKAKANVTLNVSALENIGVTADKLKNVNVNGVKVAQLSNGTVLEAAQITTDSKGEATFTVSGTNAEVTPVIFEATPVYTGTTLTSYSKAYSPSALQTTAAKVKFAAIQAEYTIELTRDGGEVAATGQANGREYKVVVKDKNGNVAKNETVNVAFNEDLDRVIATNTKAGFVNADTEAFYPTSGNGNLKHQISVKTNDKGEASFIIASETVNDYATPIAWIDINTSDAKQGKLDEGEPSTVGTISHFQAPYLDGAAIKSYKTTGGKATDKFTSAETAVFKAELVNQSGNVFTGGYTLGKVTYTVFNTGANDVKVGSTVISPNRSETFTYDHGASLYVESAENKSTSVKVVATGIAYKDGKDFAFTAKEATATFTNSATVGSEYTGYLRGYNTDAKSITFDGKTAVKYAGESGKTYEYYGTNGAPIIGEANFISALEAAAGLNTVVTTDDTAVRATYRVVDNVVKIYLLDSTQTAGFVTAKQNVAATPGVDGTIAFTPATAINYTQDLTVTVTDADLNASATALDTVAITYTLTGGANAGTHTITLTETAVNTGVFSAVIPSTLYQGATSITANYVDAKTVATTVQTRTATKAIGQYLGTVTTTAGPITPYVDGATPATLALTVGTTVAHNVDVTIGGVTNTISIPAAATTAQIAALINAKFPGVATATSATVVTLVATNTTDSISTGITSSNTAGFNTAGATVAPTPGTATPAVWAFDVTNNFAVGEKVTVTLGSVSKTVTIAGAGDAAEIVALLNASPAFSADYTVAATGSRVTLTQVTPASTTGTALTVTISK